MTAPPKTEPMPWPILIAVGTGTFMSALDGSVANTVLPVLTHALHGTVANAEWVVTVYLLVTSALVLSAGRWGDLHGQRPMYLAGFVVFILGSALCGLAPTLPWLVALRAVQALGAAGLFASSPAIVTLNFPPRRRGQALGIQATLTYLGITAGPLLGGWLTSHLGWRSVFFLNVPVGLLALGLSARFVPADAARPSEGAFDLPGTGLFASGLSALLLALNQGHAWGWGAAPTLGLLGLSGLLLTGFVAWERRAAAPMLDFGLFRDRGFSAASVSALFCFVSLNGLLFLLPFDLIEGRGLSAGRAGAFISALPLAMAGVAPLSGWISDRVGTALPAALGMAALAAASLALLRLGPDADPRALVWALAGAGAGVGVFLSPNNSALMGAAPRDRQGVAAAVRATARNLGNVLGIGVVGAVFTSALAHRASLSAPHEAVFAAFHAGLWAVAGAAVLGAAASATRLGRAPPRGPRLTDA